MKLLMNVTTAWISVGLAVTLTVIWILRIVIKKRKLKKDDQIYFWNRHLRKAHKMTGISFVVVGLIHGFLSSGMVLSLNKGTLITLLGSTMGLTYYFRKHFRNRALWIRLHRVLVILIIILIPLHLVEVGGVIGFEAVLKELNDEPAEILAIVEPADIVNNTYQDGVYTGSATGYRSGLTVEVVLNENEIKSVEIVEHNEVGERFYSPAFEFIPLQIVAEQSLDIDVVSGSTYSAVGIINATADALNQALSSGELITLEVTELEESNHKGKGKHRGGGE
jgi:uncharacterized protein with FMN-binding domain/cytochrome b561